MSLPLCYAPLDMNSRIPKPTPDAAATVTELEGLVGLGMKKDALRLARRCLTTSAVNSDTFSEALRTILTLADTTRLWRPLVDAAYQKLSNRGKRAVRPWMLFFYSAVNDHAAASRFIPDRFAGPIWPAELVFAIDTLLALDRLDEAQPLVRKAIRALAFLPHSDGRAMLISSIAAYHSRVREWEIAIRLLEHIQDNSLMAESAMFGLIDTHLQRTLHTIESARASLARLRRTSDPETDTILPGNDAARWKEAEDKLRKIERRVIWALNAAGCQPDTHPNGSAGSLTWAPTATS